MTEQEFNETSLRALKLLLLRWPAVPYTEVKRKNVLCAYLLISFLLLPHSYMTPVSCNKLWNDVKAYNDREHFETPYVAKFHR